MTSIYCIQLNGSKFDLGVIEGHLQKKYTDPAVQKAALEVAGECVPLSASEDR